MTVPVKYAPLHSTETNRLMKGHGAMATQAAPVVATGIDCVAYCTKDFARAKDFYTNQLGLRPSCESESWTEFDLNDGTTFSIVQLPNGQYYPTGGAMFAVPDVHAAVDSLKSAGVKFFGDIYESPVCFMAWAEDTEGNNFAVHQRKSTA